MLAIEVLGFWLVVSVAFFAWQRLTRHEARAVLAMSEFHDHRA
jgi:hypothetical protein